MIDISLASLRGAVASCTLRGIAPYTQSRYHGEPELDGERPNDYDLRTWRSKAFVPDGSATIHIKNTALHQALMSAAKYSKRQIPGQGKATWTAKFVSGVAIYDHVDLGVTLAEVGYVDIYANSDGIRGS